MEGTRRSWFGALVAALVAKGAPAAAAAVPVGVLVVGSDGKTYVARIGNGLAIDFTTSPQPTIERSDGVTEVVHRFNLACVKQLDGSWLLPGDAQTPDPLDSLLVFRNGVLQTPGGVDWTQDPLNAKRLTTTAVWNADDVVIAHIMFY